MNNLQFIVQNGGQLSGEIRVPGDKSISHRSIILAALATGKTEIRGLLCGADNLATVNAFRSLGVRIEGPENDLLCIHGVGLHGLTAASKALDLGNSGTSMRLLIGLMAAQSFDSVLVGDSSLSTRPMRRVTEPLSTMGAKINTSELGTAPISITGHQPLHGIHYQMPIASAQVKSCLLLAGLYASGETCVIEPAISRDHTERMLKGFGYAVKQNGNRICVAGGGKLTACNIDIPADISSAAFFMVGACIAPGSDITLKHVGINPSRDGVITILQMMGANISLSNHSEIGGEAVADIRIQASQLKGIVIPAHLVPLAIDEFPALFIAAASAQGETVLSGASELRVKESDRIQVMADGMNSLGIQAEPTDDGIRIQGNSANWQGGLLQAHGDHRIAMAFSIAALRASTEIVINDCANVATSFPNFIELAQQLGLPLTSRIATL